MKINYGHTLIEMLVAVFLSTLLLTGLMMIYITEKLNYFSVSALVDLQDRARFVSDLLRRNIREAGEAKCENKRKFVNQQHAIYGNENTIVIGKCMHYKKNNQFIQMRYFVSDTHRKDSKGDRIFALYRKPVDGEREELIAGVSGMSIKYGVATKNNRNVDHYISANAVDSWSDVDSVSITLSLSYLNTVRLLHLYVALRERIVSRI